ncbi:ChrR family anti-sigma-E factor [Shewanella litorisediminis]|uniref:Cupin domain-containing protein n=1 Tax=Shewanella litorisediminis TaxID=1173586 RepID=A0ABX7FZ57_9GAMM|nr:ChrR family anti-sigma-E factor [Shewanella litorisediminis]MCL2918705.1 ChrR family anti-sigma-E factor [Shewanella litorisediminis]QRH00322.1 cupin domain-containing protein [Shewanella litorisediminis]
MIKHHPSDEMLLAHAAGETVLGLAIALSAHCELCPACAARVAHFQDKLAKHHLPLVGSTAEATYPYGINSEATGQAGSQSSWDSAWENPDNSLDALFDAITAAPASTEAQHSYHQADSHGSNHVSLKTEVKGVSYSLPKAFRPFIANASLVSAWSGIGSVSRMRLDTRDGKARSSLLHIAAGGEIPEHTHKGQEITLLLHGHFSDEMGSYGPGDFMLTDARHQHTPKTLDGCLCYTVVDAPLHFTKGLSKLLNPIGELIY